MIDSVTSSTVNIIMVRCVGLVRRSSSTVNKKNVCGSSMICSHFKYVWDRTGSVYISKKIVFISCSNAVGSSPFSLILELPHCGHCVVTLHKCLECSLAYGTSLASSGSESDPFPAWFRTTDPFLEGFVQNVFLTTVRKVQVQSPRFSPKKTDHNLCPKKRWWPLLCGTPVWHAPQTVPSPKSADLRSAREIICDFWEPWWIHLTRNGWTSTFTDYKLRCSNWMQVSNA